MVGGGAQPAADRNIAVNPVAAVGADRVGAGFHHGRCRLFGSDSHHRPVPGGPRVKYEAGYHGQTGGARRGDGGPGLHEVGERLEQQGIDAFLCQRLGLLLERAVQLVRAGFTQGEHPPGRTDGRENTHPRSRRLTRDPRPRPIDCLSLLSEPVRGQPEAITPESVGEDDSAARLDVRAGNRLDAVRMREVPGVRAFARPEPERLKLGSPGAIRHHGACRRWRQEDGHGGLSLAAQRPTNRRATSTALAAFSP